MKFLDASIWEGKIFNGTWMTAPVSATIVEPATGEPLGQAGFGDVAAVDALAAVGAAAQPQWGDAAPEVRARVIGQAARTLEDHSAEIAEWIVRETGSVQGKADFEIGLALAELHQAAALVTQPIGHVLPAAAPDRLNLAVRVPFGVVGVIAPWNFPLILGMRSVAPALALGNAVVLKPDPQTPVSGGVVIARLFQEAGLPAGLLSVIPGGADVGEAVVTNPRVRMMTFTGSSAVGRRVGELAGRHLKRAALELGGNNAMIVLDDCDIEAASSAGAWGSFLHQGQICMTTGRHIVMRSVAERYAAALAERARRLPVGDPFRNKQVALGSNWPCFCVFLRPCHVYIYISSFSYILLNTLCYCLPLLVHSFFFFFMSHYFVQHIAPLTCPSRCCRSSLDAASFVSYSSQANRDMQPDHQYDIDGHRHRRHALHRHVCDGDVAAHSVRSIFVASVLIAIVASSLPGN